MDAGFEYRCPVHGQVRAIDLDEPVADEPQRCPSTADSVRCGLPLFIAETRAPS